MVSNKITFKSIRLGKLSFILTAQIFSLFVLGMTCSYEDCVYDHFEIFAEVSIKRSMT